MSTEQMRDEFEAWARDNAMLLFMKVATGKYRSEKTELAWQAWQASRAALVVELPAIEAWENDGRLDRERDDQADCAMGLIPRVDARAAIEAAGMRVK